jgi:uncharacterized membrane protein YphA (DoxX/SURF4 family)
LRRIARPLLASVFIYGGINSWRHAEGHAKVAEPFLDKVLAKGKGVLPDAIPTDAQTIVKIDGAVKIVAGTALALGKAPRLASLLLLGSLVPTTLSAHAFWEKSDPAERQQHTVQFIKNASVAGGLLIAASDTHGKPSLGWRAKRAKRKAARKVRGTGESVQQGLREASGKSRKLLRKAGK